MGKVATRVVRILRWVIMAAVVSVSAAVVLPVVMVGTNVQLIGVFFWAFFVDIAYDGLIRSATGFVGGPKVT